MSSPLAPPVQGFLPRPLMLELAALVQPPELPVEGREQAGVRGHVLHAHGLPDGVHGEGGHAQVHGPDAHPGRDDGADGGAARAVVPHYELLDGSIRPASQLAEEEAGLGVSGVPGNMLLSVVWQDLLYYITGLPHLWLLFVLITVPLLRRGPWFLSCLSL